MIYKDVRENRGRIYGTNAMQYICKYFGWNEGVIYNCMRIAEVFTDEEIEAICGMQMPDGKKVYYSHLLALIDVRDRDQRNALIKQTVENSWSAKQLWHEIEPELKSKKPAGDRRGRPVAAPKRFEDVLAQMDAFSDDFLNRAQHVWQHSDHSLSAKLVDLSDDDINEKRANKLVTLANKLSELSRISKELEREVHGVHTEFMRLMAAKPAPALKVIGTTAEEGDEKSKEAK
jgi:hypothetical protein